jgi:hypothetical protein
MKEVKRYLVNLTRVDKVILIISLMLLIFLIKEI